MFKTLSVPRTLKEALYPPKINMSEMNLERLAELIRSLELNLEDKSISPTLKKSYEDLLKEKSEQYTRLITQRWRGQLLRPAFIRLLNILGRKFNANNSDAFIRRAFVAAHFGIISSDILKMEGFEALAPHFPRLKLPISPAWIQLDLNIANYRGLPLKMLIEKYIEDFHYFKGTRPEANLQIGIWGPILTDLANFMKVEMGIPEIHAVNELNCSTVIKSFPWRRFTDFALIVRDCLPLLLVEMAEKEVSHGMQHKDTKKMMITMAHILMELLSRSEVHCPNEDFTGFKVFGLLIGGKIFELCVGTVVSENGKINFVFNHNDTNWKFPLFGENNLQILPQNMPGAGDVICDGSEIEIGTFQRSVQTTQEGTAESEEAIDILPEPEEEETLPEFSEFIDFGGLSSIDQFENSIKVLLKFLQISMSYFANLSPCLKECYFVEPEGLESSDLKFLPKKYIPAFSVSASKHGSTSKQDLSVIVVLQNDQMSDQEAIFYQSFSSHPNLPEVILYDTAKESVLIKSYAYRMDDFMKKTFKVVNPLNMRTLEYLGLLFSNFMIDLLISAKYIHENGFICGAYETKYVSSDGMFWRLDRVPRICRVDEAQQFEIPIEEKGSFGFHYSAVPSQRGDIYSISKLSGYLTRCYHYGFVLEERERLPLLDNFLKTTFEKMINYQDFPNLSAEDLLKSCIPIFCEMEALYNTDVSDTRLRSSSIVYQSIYDMMIQSSESSQGSIETEPIEISELTKMIE